MAGTGEWLLDHDNFTAWMEKGNPVLWCSGDPGAGKSVLMYVMSERLGRNGHGR